ncbi:esterase-like activity of phytase family protein [Marinomonas pollencensis]|nr:esterase-like activity of phytase family protein [Marinomonas pollencensis]
MSYKICLVSVVSVGVLVGCAANSSSTEPRSFVDAVPKTGSPLPYQVLRNDLQDVRTGKAFEIRNGGYGSAMTGHPDHPNQFYALTDRGPNATYTGALGKGKMFPVADYTPRIGLFEVQADGSIKQLETILLRRPDASLITGLPNSSALGGTGETPYDAQGNAILEDPSQPYNKQTNPIKLDDYGLDGEGLVAMKDGTFWVSDEYGPHLVHYDSNGVEIGRINAFKNDPRVTYHLPAVLQNRRANRGMEGLAVTPDNSTLVGIMQSTLANPNKAAQKSDVTRIVSVRLDNGQTEQYLYRQEKAQNSNSELAALSGHEFLVDERDGGFMFGGLSGQANPNVQKQVYRIDLNSGTPLSSVALSASVTRDAKLGLMIDGLTLEQYVGQEGWSALAKKGIKPVSKTLVVDVAKRLDYPHDKMEGLWVIDQHHLGVLNDDDFATWSTQGKLEQKYLDQKRVDDNRLYVLNVDLSTASQ